MIPLQRNYKPITDALQELQKITRIAIIYCYYKLQALQEITRIWLL